MNHAAIALHEFTRRRQLARESVAGGLQPIGQASVNIRLWAGIAAWFGAQLPDDARAYEGWQSWLDHAPRGASAAQWQNRLALELRRAALAQLARAEAQPTPASITRARELLALDNELSIAARLPAIGATQDQTERKVA